MYFYFNIMCWIHSVLFSIFSSDTPSFAPVTSCRIQCAIPIRGRKTTVVRCRCSFHPPWGCKVKCPPSGSSQWMLCLAPETPPPSHCRNWHEAGGRLSEPGVVLFIWERKWPFWKNAAQRPVSKGLSAFTVLLLRHFTPSQGWKWIAGQPGPSSFSSSVDVPPLHLTLQRVISASSYFFHGFATQRPNQVRLTDLPSTSDLFFLFLKIHTQSTCGPVTIYIQCCRRSAQGILLFILTWKRWRCQGGS